ncbi:hypothetical protein GCM10017744_100870 [Streptomyces antimycoticus]
MHLDRLGRERGVRAFSLHPGGILTPLQRHLPKQEMVERGWIDEDGNLLHPRRSRHRSRVRHAGVGGDLPQLDGMGGVYLDDCDIAEPARRTAPGRRQGVGHGPEQAAACGRCPPS